MPRLSEMERPTPQGSPYNGQYERYYEMEPDQVNRFMYSEAEQDHIMQQSPPPADQAESPSSTSDQPKPINLPTMDQYQDLLQHLIPQFSNCMMRHFGGGRPRRSCTTTRLSEGPLCSRS